MRLIALIFLLITFGIFNAYGEAKLEISEIYVEASGNNKYEARIKAYEESMMRSLLMIADKIGLNPKDISPIPFNVLKKAFTVSKTLGEVEAEEFYSATISYQYDINTLNILLLEYGNQQIKDRFYEYLIIPIFKQRKTFDIWDNKQIWNKKWLKVHSLLDESKIYQPISTALLKHQITPTNIFSLSYDDFLEMFYGKLFKKVLLVVCEYFTDNITGKSVMEIQYIYLNEGLGRPVTHDLYPINSMEELPRIMNQAIINTIKKHVTLRQENEKKMYNLLNDFKIDVSSLAEENKVNRIVLDIEIYDKEELLLIENKLKKVSQIESYEVKQTEGTNHKIIITTRLSEYELAEGFYENGLSFKNYGNLYKLIDVKYGL